MIATPLQAPEPLSPDALPRPAVLGVYSATPADIAKALTRPHCPHRPMGPWKPPPRRSPEDIGGVFAQLSLRLDRPACLTPPVAYC
jgi:hypothetical protein